MKTYVVAGNYEQYVHWKREHPEESKYINGPSDIHGELFGVLALVGTWYENNSDLEEYVERYLRAHQP